MQWALINDSADPEIYGPIGHISNIILYDGVSPYTPEEGLRLAEVPDNVKIGDLDPGSN